MTASARGTAARCRRHRFWLALVFACSATAAASAQVRAQVRNQVRTELNTDVHIESGRTQVRVTADNNATVSDVLAAIAEYFNLKYRTEIPLDATADAVYAGSLTHVISRLLDDYTYVVKWDEETMEIVVLGRRGEATASPAAPKGAAIKGAQSRQPHD